MAKATRKFKEVEKIVKEQVVDGVTLELTQDEAQYLRNLLGHTCGITGLSGALFSVLTPFTNYHVTKVVLSQPNNATGITLV